MRERQADGLDTDQGIWDLAKSPAVNYLPGFSVEVPLGARQNAPLDGTVLSRSWESTVGALI